MHGPLAPRADPRAALVAWRRSIPYTQGEVGALFRVSKQAVGNWETGRARVPARVRARLRAEGWLPAPPRPHRTPLQHTPLCAPDAGCRSCGMRRARARTPDWRARGNVWTSEQHAWLRAHAGEAPLPELARRITTAFGIPRTPHALAFQLWRLGVSSLTAHLTVNQVAHYSGVHRDTVRGWLRRGWLVLPDWAERRHRNSDYVIPADAFETFIRQHAHHLIVAQMPDGPYRHLAAACWAQHRWLTVTQAAQFAGVSPPTIGKWLRYGRCPGQQAHRQGAKRIWLVRARDLAAFVRTRAVARRLAQGVLL